MSKDIDNIYPPYVAALKQYARDLLTHVNPHTGLAYRDDPAVAIVEVNNENSLLMNSFWPAKISGPVKDSILQQWRAWVAKTYAGDDAKLRASWGTRPEGDGTNLIANGTFANQAAGWNLNQEGGSVCSQAPAAEGRGVRVTVSKAGSANWHSQLSHYGVHLEGGKRYRLRFRARADAPHKIYTCTQETVAPYGMAGLWTEVKVETGWQVFEYFFTAKPCAPDKVSLNFGPNGNTGWFEFADVHLDAFDDGFLPASASIAGGLPLPDENARQAVLRDYYRFLAEVELGYAREMHRFLKEDIKVRCLVTHSHIFFGALLGVRREALASDLVHANAYWHHPSFPNSSWSDTDWETNQKILTQEPDGGVLAELAVQRVAGKPFALTEWDIPAPIDSLAEGLPMLAAFAAYQGWSGVTLYTFAHGHADMRADHYHSFFNYQGHPAKRAGVPFAALLFRTGAVSPGRERATFTVSKEALFDDIATYKGNLWSNWRRFYQAAGLDGTQALKRQTDILIAEEGNQSAAMRNAASKEAPAISDNGQITWGSGDAIARVVSDRVLFASGSLGGRTLPLGSCQLKTGVLSGDGFAVWGMIPLDGKPLEQSRKLLGLALRRSENEGMVWRGDRRSVGNQWGKGPSLVLGYQASVTLPGNDAWKISALGPDGKVSSVIAESSREWNITPAARTVWWLLEKTESSQSGK